jgi:hypothetical protein
MRRRLLENRSRLLWVCCANALKDFLRPLVADYQKDPTMPRSNAFVAICPYCGNPPCDCDLEEIFPRSIGGNREFGIYVCKTCNNELGSRIDAPFVEQPFIQQFLIKYNLRGHHTSVPAIDMPVATDRFGKVRLRATGDEVHIPATVSKVAPGDIRIFGSDTAEIESKLTSIENGLRAAGRNPKRVFYGESDVQLPNSVITQADDCIRFLVKVGLGSLAFAHPSLIAKLPNCVNLRTAIKGTISEVDEFLEFRVAENAMKEPFAIESAFPGCHTVMFSNTDRGLFEYISVFSAVTAAINLGQLPSDHSIRQEEGIAVDYIGRKMQRFLIGPQVNNASGMFTGLLCKESN